MTTVKIKSGDWEVEASTTRHFEYPSEARSFITTSIESAVKNYVEPKSSIKQSDLDMRDNQIMLLKEDLEVVHMYLDGLLVPRKDENGEAYSIVGRIKQFENEMVKQVSNLESIYLEEQSKMYTESEVEKHLETQRGNCWVAAEGGVDKIMGAPEPGHWRKTNNDGL
jgi:gamma-glutamylcyclotransferase (GGCT)/AIG2-like uncharacterized protein YtfP